ncbi:MAG: FkbM family methyltransferase [Candidatus Parvarchaeota archaeon]
MHNKTQAYYLLHHGIELSLDQEGSLFFYFKGQKISFVVSDTGHVEGDIYSIFFKEDYKFLTDDPNFKSSTVIDVGSNICDSTIYFAVMGAKLTVAIEGNKVAYETGLRNLRLNGLQEKVVSFNCFVGDRNEIYRGQMPDKPLLGITIPAPSGEGEIVVLKTIQEIFRELRIEGNVLLKMDCEGCEYSVIESLSTDEIRRFSRIVLEYHKGSKVIEKKLRMAGFSVFVGRGRKAYNPESDRYLEVGFLYAVRLVQ